MATGHVIIISIGAVIFMELDRVARIKDYDVDISC